MNLGDAHDLKNPFSHAELLKLDEAEAFPTKQIEVLDQQNVHHHFVPKEFGGELTDFRDVFDLIRKLAHRDLTLAIGKAKTLLGALPIWIGGEPEMKRRLAERLLRGEDISLALTERGHGSDLLASETEASQGAEGFTVKGEKWLINNATRSSTLSLLARTSPGQDARSFSFLYFEKDHSKNFTCTPKIPTVGIRGADISGIKFDNAPVAKENLVGGKPGRAFEQLVKTFQVSRTVCAALSLGAGFAAFEIVREFLNDRVLYGTSIAEKPVVANALARIERRLKVCETLAHAAVHSLATSPEQMGLLSSVAKYWVPTQVESILNELATLLGARHFIRSGGGEDYFQKIKRDHSLVPLFDGSTQVNLQNVFMLMSPSGVYEPIPPTSSSFSFDRLTLKRATNEPWLGVLRGTSFEEELVKQNAQLETLLAPEARWSSEAFELAKRRCHLYAAAAVTAFAPKETWTAIALKELELA